MNSIGVVYVAYGDAARREARLAIKALRDMHSWPVVVISDKHLDNEHTVIFKDVSFGARWAKLNLDQLVPREWTHILYMDADTRVHADISAGFTALDAGFDMAICPSENQGGRCMQHVGAEERQVTRSEIGNPHPLQLQAGVMFMRRNAATARLFEEWRTEWKLYEEQDQAALLRALYYVPVRLWLLSNDYNGGSKIEHLFGRARR